MNSEEFEEFKKKHPSAVLMVKLTMPDDMFIFMTPETWQGIKDAAEMFVPPNRPELVLRIKQAFPLMFEERVLYLADLLQAKALEGEL